MPSTVLIAIGGNALLRPNEPPTASAERTRLVQTARVIADIAARGWRIVLTHGNGPQVGAALTRSERAAAEAYPLPLDMCVASTQGEVGYLLQQALGTAFDGRGIHRPIATVVTQVVVDRHDPAFRRPTKPVGPFYADADSTACRTRGWTMVHDPPHGWRRAVPSPEPLEIVEEPVIRALSAANVVVIALGGGGVPVVRGASGLAGVDAVVDKDLGSALLAERLHVDRFILATDVDRIYLDFSTPTPRGLDEVTVEELGRHAAAGQFPAGSMGPKVEAVCRFVEGASREATVCALDQLPAALEGCAGTRILARSADQRAVEERRRVPNRRGAH